MNRYQGGLPSLRSKYNQHGSGFLSALKRFVVPLAKKVIPHMLGGVSDVISGDATPMEALKRRGGDALGSVLNPGGPPTKKYKRGPAQRRKPKPKKKNRTKSRR